MGGTLAAAPASAVALGAAEAICALGGPSVLAAKECVNRAYEGNLNDGILRTAFRDSLSAPTPIEPGRPYPLRIQIWPTSYEFRAGERIRVEISSSDYPQFAPNPNTGAPFGQGTATAVASQTILHDAQHPSSVVLPVIAG